MIKNMCPRYMFVYGAVKSACNLLHGWLGHCYGITGARGRDGLHMAGNTVTTASISNPSLAIPLVTTR